MQAGGGDVNREGTGGAGAGGGKVNRSRAGGTGGTGIVGCGEVDPGGRVGPAAAAVNAGVGAHGAKDHVAGDGDLVGGFHEKVENGMEIFAALEIQPRGAGVAVEGAIVGELVLTGEIPGGAPVEEFLFDEAAFGVAADEAFAAVTVEELDLEPFSGADPGGVCGSAVRGLGGSGHVSFSFLGLSFGDSRAAGRGRAGRRREIVRCSSSSNLSPCVFGSDSGPATHTSARPSREGKHKSIIQDI